MTAIDASDLFAIPSALDASDEGAVAAAAPAPARRRLIAPLLSVLVHSAVLVAFAVTAGPVAIGGTEPATEAIDVTLVATIAPPAAADFALAVPDALEPRGPPDFMAPVEIPPDEGVAPVIPSEPARSEPTPVASPPDALAATAPITPPPPVPAPAPVAVVRPSPPSPPPVRAKPTAARPRPVSVAPARTAPMPTQATTGGASASPARVRVGQGGAKDTALADYLASVRARIVSQRRAPLGADRGRVDVRFTIARDGRLGDVRASGAASDGLEEEALRIVRRASPVAAIPAEVGRADLAMTVTIDFR